MTRWLTQFKQEARRQRVKTLVLACGAALAAILWGPIIWSWVAREENSLPVAFEFHAQPSGQTSPLPKQDWRTLRESRTALAFRAYDNTEQVRDPFVRPEANRETGNTSPAAPPPPPRVTPQQAGLQLEATLEVGRVGAAKFNQQLFREGEMIVIHGKPTGFQLRSVGNRRVVVTRDGYEYALQVSRQGRQLLSVSSGL